MTFDPKNGQLFGLSWQMGLCTSERHFILGSRIPMVHDLRLWNEIKVLKLQILTLNQPYLPWTLTNLDKIHTQCAAGVGSPVGQIPAKSIFQSACFGKRSFPGFSLNQPYLPWTLTNWDTIHTQCAAGVGAGVCWILAEIHPANQKLSKKL